jgi:protein-L-isoaspartate(D-aspartate) O-methyltransferase
MVQKQLRDRGIRDERVLSAMATVPREKFILPEDSANAYGDFPLHIGDGQTISQPYIVADMLEKLELLPADRTGAKGANDIAGARLRQRTCCPRRRQQGSA